MQELGKDPRWYSLRSIRQGASTTACAMEMPEVFLRATGGWKGNALELYRKDRLPSVQRQFATRLGANAKVNTASDSPSRQIERLQNTRPDRSTRGTRGSIRAVITPRRLPSRGSGEPVCARDSREFERGRARLRGTNPFLARNVTHEVLSGKFRFGQSKGMSPGQAWVGGDMTI